MVKSRLKLSVVGWLILAAWAGCNSTSSSDTTDDTDNDSGIGTDSSDDQDSSTATGAAIAANLKVAGGAPQGLHLSGLIVGQNAALDLQSMKYYITSIQICEDMQTSGSSFSSPQNCLELYRGAQESHYEYTLDQPGQGLDCTEDNSDPESPNASNCPINQADFARGTDDGFIDLMSETSRAALSVSTPLLAEHAHAYNYGLVNWALPIKVQASITMSDDSTLYTHDGASTRVEIGQDGYIAFPTITTTPLTDSPAEEAVVIHQNGGSWFKFQSPLTITDADIEAQTQYVLDLAFNPDGLLKGYTDNYAQSIKDESGNGINVPMLDLTPVPHRAAETITKETYIATIDADSQDFDIRFELYYVKEDPDKVIYGLDAKTLVNADTTLALPDFSKVNFLVSNTDETLDMLGHDQIELVTGFHRLTNVGDTTDETTDATLHCGTPETGGFSYEGCSDTAPLRFTLTAVTDL